MTIVAAHVHSFELPLLRPHTTAAGTISARIGHLVELVDDMGRSGWGEAAPLPGRSAASREDTAAALARLAGQPPGIDPSDVVAPRSVMAAIDTAVLDLRGQDEDVPLSRLLAPTPAAEVPVSALLTSPDPDEVAAGAASAVASGVRTIKLKMAGTAADVDIERVNRAREAAGDHVSLRLDANQGWDAATAIEVLRQVEALEIEFVEEPVPTPGDFRRIRDVTGIAIGADESLETTDDVAGFVASHGVEVAVLKPSLLGGPTRTMRLAHDCRAAGARTVISSALDAAVGLTAALHVAAAIDHHGAAGLGTSALLASDVATAPQVRRGVLKVPTGPGLGLGPIAPPG